MAERAGPPGPSAVRRTGDACAGAGCRSRSLTRRAPRTLPRRLLGVASVRDRAIVLLLLDTGLRVSEAAGIRLGDLRPDGSVKGDGQGRQGPDRPDRLDRPRSDRPLPRPAGTGSDGRSPLPRSTRRARLARDAAVFKRLKTRAGITGRCSPHSLRHTFARSYLVNGGDVFSLQRILGHTTLDMVKRYVSMADADVAAKHRTASPADRLVGKPGR